MEGLFFCFLFFFGGGGLVGGSPGGENCLEGDYGGNGPKTDLAFWGVFRGFLLSVFVACRMGLAFLCGGRSCVGGSSAGPGDGGDSGDSGGNLLAGHVWLDLPWASS